MANLFQIEKIISFLFVLISGVLLSGCAAKQVHTNLADNPTGKIYFETASPYDYIDIYDGLENDKKSVIHGDLVFPNDSSEKVPAIVFFHGSGGIQAKHSQWLTKLHQMGVATFQVDSFDGRGISSIIGEQERLPHPSMLVDAYMALKILSTHPRIDKNRIGVMGGSKGGVVAVYTAYEPVRKAVVGDELKFSLHLGIYPFCHRLQKQSMTGAPILILTGEKDDWTPAILCEKLVDALKLQDYPIDIKIYPDAHHGFDREGGLRYVENAYNFENCDFLLLEEGVIIETNSNQKMDTIESRKKVLSKCAKRGTHTEGSPAATAAAINDMEEFVSVVFRLK